MDGYDESGWWLGAIEPLAAEAAYSLLAPEPGSRVDAARWAHQARRFFDLELSVEPAKQYPAGGQPRVDALEACIEGRAGRARVRIVTLPAERAASVVRAADAAARAIGGAGFDVLVSRAKRVWQVAGEPLAGDDPQAALRVAAVLSSLMLAPLLTPDGAIFGVKGARERLARGAGRLP